MKLFCPHCKEQLYLKHKVEIEMLSNFHWTDDNIIITKHTITDFLGYCRMLSSKDIKSLHCAYCEKDVDVDKTLFICDACRDMHPKNDVNFIGKLLTLCSRCTKKNEYYKDFLIFGKRNLPPDRRESRVENIIENATERDVSVIDFIEQVRADFIPIEPDTEESLDINEWRFSPTTSSAEGEN